MAYNPNHPVAMSPLPVYYQNTMNDQPLMHLLTKIPAHINGKLNIFGALFILQGLIAIGLDTGAYLHGFLR